MGFVLPCYCYQVITKSNIHNRYGSTQMSYSEVALMINYLLCDRICLQLLLLACLC